MSLRILITVAAALVCAIWPQAVLLCLAEDGHVEIEPAGAACCPDGDGDCHDCEDVSAPDLASAAGAVVLAPPEVPSAPCPGLDEDPASLSFPTHLSPFPDESLRTVVLIV